jgi:hypothetical protein
LAIHPVGFFAFGELSNGLNILIGEPEAARRRYQQKFLQQKFLQSVIGFHL